MNDLTFAYFWCVVQVIIVSAGVLVLTRFLTKRQPDIAAAITGWAAASLLAMTFFVPLQIPNWSLGFEKNHDIPVSLSDNVQQRGTATSSSTKFTELEGSVGFHFDPMSLLRKTVEIRESQPPIARRIAGYIGIGICFGVVVGIAKLILGMMMLRSLQRRAEVIQEADFKAIAHSILSEIGVTRHVTFAQSCDIGCAAVVGVFRPTILLSHQWKSWSPCELRAVLAHEVAHVFRRDSWWRLVATVCVAIHFYNPLVRWLLGRLILAQELAADRLAISIAGGQGSYLRSLSSLAIRQDQRPYVRPQPLFTPVFAGHLLRRIDMLRAMDCKQNRTPRSWMSSAVIAVMLLFGTMTTAMRGYAQTPEQKASPPTSVTQISATKVVDAKSSTPWNSTLFQREKFPAADPAFSEKGGVRINFKELAKVKPLLSMFESIIFGEMLPQEFAENCDISILDSLSADAQWGIQHRVIKGKGMGDKQSLTFGASGIKLRVNRDVDWQTAIENMFSETVTKMGDGLEYLEANIPALGPVATRFYHLSPRELTLSMGGIASGFDASEIRSRDQQNPAWSGEWDAAGGGLIALHMVMPEFETPPTMDDQPEQLRVIYQNIKATSFGFDSSEDALFMELRIHLTCNDSVDPNLVLTSVRELIELYQDQIQAQPSSGVIEIMGKRMISDTLDHAKTQVRRGNSNVVECHLQFALTPKLLVAILAEAKSTETAPKAERSAEKTDAATKR